MAEVVNGAVRNPSGSAPQRLIVGISGASGVTYGVRVLDALRELGVTLFTVGIQGPLYDDAKVRPWLAWRDEQNG